MKRDHGADEPKLTFTDHPFRPVASTTNRRYRPVLTRLQTGHDRSPTWTPTRRCRHRRPGGDLRGRPWICAGIHHTPDALSPGHPGSFAPRLTSAASSGEPELAASVRRPRYMVSRRSLIFSPLAGTCQHEPEQARCHVDHAASSAHRRRRLPDAGLALRPSSDLPSDSVRVACDPHRASEATKCHAALCPRPPLARLPPARHRSVTPDGPRAAVRAPRGALRFAAPAVTRRNSR